MENFLAHTYPDMVAAFVAPVVLLTILFVFDWRFGLASFIAIIIAFGIQMIVMGFFKFRAHVEVAKKYCRYDGSYG